MIIVTQEDRADNVISGSKTEQLDLIRRDISEFKRDKKLDKVIVLWTANTERFTDVIPGVNDTDENLLKSLKENHPEISPSTMFAVAAAMEGVRDRPDFFQLLYSLRVLTSFFFYQLYSVPTSTDLRRTLSYPARWT